jgi:dienelactone hydrolase
LLRRSAPSLDEEGPAQWENRVRDVNAIINALPEIETKYPELAGKIDATRIGVGGHSYGAFTAMLLGGVKTMPGGTSFANQEVDAVLAMSPQGPAERWRLTSESWASVNVPMMYMTGTLDRGIADSETPEWRRESFASAPARGDQWLVVIEGAQHASFTGRLEDLWAAEADRRLPNVQDPWVGGNPGAPRPGDPGLGRNRGGARVLNERAIFHVARSTAVAFWDLYLRKDEGGRPVLAGGGRSEVTSK